MTSGTILTTGQNFIVDIVHSYLNTNGVYIGLMSNTSAPDESSQLPSASGISEINAPGYSRIYCDNWTKYNDGQANPYIKGETVTFTPVGSWSNIYGYFVASSSLGNDALWAETFPNEVGGDISEPINITPIYGQKN